MRLFVRAILVLMLLSTFPAEAARYTGDPVPIASVTPAEAMHVYFRVSGHLYLQSGTTVYKMRGYSSALAGYCYWYVTGYPDYSGLASASACGGSTATQSRIVVISARGP